MLAWRILSTVSAEPAVLRWLHSHDPDRVITHDLLKSSATYMASVPKQHSQAIAGSILPPTTSLIVPMYRRNHFILGQLYGPVSPNAMGLNMRAQGGRGLPPESLCRRFVVDLSFDDSLMFIEYEWFSNGTLCVSMHSVTSNNRYEGESILLDYQPGIEPNIFRRKEDMFRNRNLTSPTRIIMRLKIAEHSQCQTCSAKGQVHCTCPPSMPPKPPPHQPHKFVAPINWETWLAVFAKSRMNRAQMKLNYSIVTPSGNKEHSFSVPIIQSCEIGIDPNSPRGNLLVTKFMAHPTSNVPGIHSKEKCSYVEESAALSEEDENCPQPQVPEVEVHGKMRTLHSQPGSPSMNHAQCGESSTQHRIEIDNGLSEQDEYWTQPKRLEVETHGKMNMFHSNSCSPSPNHAQRGESSTQDRIEIANDLSEEDGHWTQPQLPEVETHGKMKTLYSQADSPSTPHAQRGVSSAQTTVCKQELLTAASASTQLDHVRRTVVESTESASQREFVYIKQENSSNPPVDLGPRKKIKPPKRREGQTRLYECLCGKVFHHRGHYNEHRRCVHDKVRQHKCIFVDCESRFFKKSDRDRHMRSKHGSPFIKCSLCGDSLKGIENLTAHMHDKHESQQRYSCEACPLSFDTFADLHLHLPQCKS